MANVSVTQNDYIFTATVYTDQSPSVTDGNYTITIYTPSENRIAISNTLSRVDIVSEGIMTILAASTVTIYESTGTGIQTVFNLPGEVLGTDYVEVTVGGVVQNPGINDSYTVGTVNTGTESAYSFVKFSEAPLNGLPILARYYTVRVAQDIQGPPGIPGPFTNINVGTVNTTTGAASVNTTGTSGNRFLNFVLPWVQGERGPRGIQGPGASNLSWSTLPYVRGADGLFDVTIGRNAGGTAFAGTDTPGPYGPYNGSISIGEEAGYQSQSTASIAIGYRAGYYLQGGPARDPIVQQSPAVAIGSEAGTTNQGDGAVAIGRLAGTKNQGDSAVALGRRAGTDTQFSAAVAIGNQAGERRQGTDTVAVGSLAGQTNQGKFSIGIGASSANSGQGEGSVAIGLWAGRTNQGDQATAVGYYASTSTQGDFATSVGRLAGASNQGTRAVAIGSRAGEINQGNFSVAIGGGAGQTNQPANTIVINAQGSLPDGSVFLNPTTANAFYVKPVRRVISPTQPIGFSQMLYNPTTGEIIYWTTS